jgi:hypothetical protein
MSEQSQGNWYVLLFGLDCENSPMVIAPGLSLRRLSSPITIFDLAAVGAAGFQQWPMLGPVANGCKCEIETAKDADITPGYDALNRAWLGCALLLLRGYGKHLALVCCNYSWDKIAGHQKRTSNVFNQQMASEGVESAVFKSNRDLPKFDGHLLDFHTHFFVIKIAEKNCLTAKDAAWANAHFEQFNKLAAESIKFRFALEAAMDWRFTKNPRIALARLWSGIEALFGITSELVYRISLLCAFLLESPGESRRLRFQTVKKLYGIRSKAVHGEDLSEDKLHQGMADSFELLRDLLLVAVERGSEFSELDLDRTIFH